MKNHLIDLNNHLFTTLERLNEEGIDAATLKPEIERAKAITEVSKQIIDNARLALDAEIAREKFDGLKTPKMISNDLEQ